MPQPAWFDLEIGLRISCAGETDNAADAVGYARSLHCALPGRRCWQNMLHN
ncbi:MAG TPA: hypothetical protein VMV97_08260 [Sulfuriferula sp.]|nr:hypothetical protein [Sulfuriferula sp.]